MGQFEIRRIRSVFERKCSRERPWEVIVESPQRMWQQLKSPSGKVVGVNGKGEGEKGEKWIEIIVIH